MGRKMFGGGDGTCDEDWKGWWGEDPPYHVPVFVLTHHSREPLEMELDPVEVVASPTVTHIRYRVVR